MNSESRPQLRYAELDWDAQGQPRSRRFKDVYFSRAGGLAEAQHTFLDGNGLAQRFAALTPGAQFVVAETGFGTGLNLLACCALWQRTAPPSARLRFISIEQYPLHASDLQRALALWPELAPWGDRLAANYPDCLQPGFHQLVLSEHIELTLIIAEAASGLAALMPSRHPCHRWPNRPVDAWFLDGFSPARNESMWSDEVLASVRQLSAPGTTVATFSAAGAVRRGLQAQGFEVKKVPGFGRKRDMLRARLTQPPPRPLPSAYPTSPYRSAHGLAWAVQRPPSARPRKIAIIGAGLAGTQLAHALAKRGCQLTVYEASGEAGGGASGNRQGLIYGRLSAHSSPQADFNMAALNHAARYYRDWLSAPEASRLGARSGLLQLATGASAVQEQQQLQAQWPGQTLFQSVSAPEASELAGVPLAHGGLYFPHLGWVAPGALCAALLETVGLSVRARQVTQLEPDGHGWRLLDEQQRELDTFDAVVLANGNAVSQFSQAATLPLKPLRGQLSDLDQSCLQSPLRLPLCAEGYVAPVTAGRFSFGASYRPGDLTLSTSDSEHEENLQRLHEQFPGLTQTGLTAADCSGRAGLRCTTPDRLPLIGPLPEVSSFRERFALLAKNAQASIAATGSYHPNLFVSTGYGSRGLAYIPICTAWLVSQLLQEPPTVSRRLAESLHPARFLIRDLIRGRT